MGTGHRANQARRPASPTHAEWRDDSAQRLRLDRRRRSPSRGAGPLRRSPTASMTPLDDRPSPTSPGRWLRIKTVVQAALDRPAGDRTSFIARECADDDLRLEVASLLAASEAAEAGDDFLVPPTAGGELLRGLLEGAGASVPDVSAERVGAALSDRYTLERELGRGGMAVVYLARDLRHGRPVAIKMLAQEIGAALPRERLDREILVTARLQHPHILPLHDSGEVDGSLYYV